MERMKTGERGRQAVVRVDQSRQRGRIRLMWGPVALHSMRTAAVARIGRWADDHPLLARLSLVIPAIVVGAVLAETGRVDGIEPGLWGRGAVRATILYGLMGSVGLMFFAMPAWFLLGMVFLWIRWTIRLPVQIARWMRRVGGRGLAGYALVGCSVLLAVYALSALGDFRTIAVNYWIEAFFRVALVTIFGGLIGGLTLVIVASGLRNSLARGLPEPSDHEPTVSVLLSLGFVAGAAGLWHWSGTDDLVWRASGAGMDWVTGPIVLAVAHGYLVAVVAIGTLTRAVRVRAGLLPRRDPDTLVWHEGGDVPRRPRETHWSPEAVVGWRSWNVSGGYLVGHHRQPWKQATFVATCQVGHRRPEWLCNCGIYALKRPELVDGVVVGRVALEGIVIEHEDGYRAEQARIIELWVVDPAIADWVRQTYPDIPINTGVRAPSDGG